MSQKIRIGNDIDIRWSLVDDNENPYILEGRDVRIELNVGKKKIRITEIELNENTVHFIYYGKDQKYTGQYILKFIENDGNVEMVTFDTKDAFTLVEHSWLAIDDGEEPERVYLEFVTVTSNILERIGPTGPAAGFGEVTASIDDGVGTPTVDVSTSGPDTAKNITFNFHNLKGASAGVRIDLGSGSTVTGADIAAILADGKIPYAMNGEQYVYYVGSDNTYYYFQWDYSPSAQNAVQQSYRTAVPKNGAWGGSFSLVTPEDARNKVTSLSADSTDVQYPSAKAVYDFVTGNFQHIYKGTLASVANPIEGDICIVPDVETEIPVPSGTPPLYIDIDLPGSKFKWERLPYALVGLNNLALEWGTNSVSFPDSTAANAQGTITTQGYTEARIDTSLSNLLGMKFYSIADSPYIYLNGAWVKSTDIALLSDIPNVFVAKLTNNVYDVSAIEAALAAGKAVYTLLNQKVYAYVKTEGSYIYFCRIDPEGLVNGASVSSIAVFMSNGNYIPYSVDLQKKISSTNKLDFSLLSNTPTTLAGYGITNAYTKNEIDAKVSSVYKPAGSAASVAALGSLTAANLGNVYNMSAAFTTTSDFVEGASKDYPAGTNVVIVNTGTDADPVYKYDVLAGMVDLSGYEETANKVTSLSAQSTDAQYPSAKAVYDAMVAGEEIFLATYGTTTAAEITRARNAGKLVFAVMAGTVLPCVISSGRYTLFCGAINKKLYVFELDNSNNAWNTYSYDIETQDNRVTTISASSTDVQYPSAKAVNDFVVANKQIFWATYGTTTAAEIDAALAAGKVVVTTYSNRIYYLSEINQSTYAFINRYSANMRTITLNRSTNAWTEAGFSSQATSNLVTSFGSTPSDSKYPSEKLVKNSLDAKQNVISSSNKLDYSLIDNVPQDATPVSQSDQQFTFRQTAGGAKPGASLAKVTEVRGKSLVWNQKVPVYTATTTTYKGLTLTPTSMGVYTISGTTDGSGNIIFQADGGKFVSGHKYFFGYYSVTAKIDGVATNQARLYLRDINNNVTVGQLNPNSTETAVIATANSAGTIYVYLNFSANVAISGTLSPMAIDLTQEYGSGHEPTVAEFEALYREKYYAFNAGTLLNNKVATLETVGFNQWDEEYKFGYYQQGGYSAYNSNICSKNLIPCLPSTAYYIKTSGKNAFISFYDAAGVYIPDVYTGLSPQLGTQVNDNTIATPQNAHYMTFNLASAYGTTYNHDICINISDPSRNGTYEPYEKHTLTLNLPTLTGKLNGEGSSVTIAADGLKSAGSAYDYGVVENGFLTKIVRAVDTRAYASGDESLATVTTDGSTYTNYALTTPEVYILDTPIPVTYFVNDLGTESISPTGVDANGVPNTASLRASLQYGMTEGEMYELMGDTSSAPVQDVTVGGTSVVSDGTAVIPAIPEVSALTTSEIDTIWTTAMS